MNNQDWKNSKVRYIPVEDKEVTTGEYLVAYSFILTHGWRRVLTGVDELGENVYHWIAPDGTSVETVYEAQDIQHLRLMQESE